MTDRVRLRLASLVLCSFLPAIVDVSTPAAQSHEEVCKLLSSTDVDHWLDAVEQLAHRGEVAQLIGLLHHDRRTVVRTVPADGDPQVRLSAHEAL